MKIISVYTFFDRNRKPLISGLYNPSTQAFHIVPFNIAGTGMPVYEVWENIAKFARLMEKFLLKGYTIVLSDFKEHLSGFPFPLVQERLQVYDLFLTQSRPPTSVEKAERFFKRILPQMATTRPLEWQRYSANAAVVYQSLENRGVLSGGIPRWPIWSQKTFSGRSKTLQFNTQGAVERDQITNPSGHFNDAFLHFDWRGADIRIAALLSGDENLLELSEKHDPYQIIADKLNSGTSDGVSRDRCKDELLKAINSMNTNLLILDLFPKLRSWIIESGRKLNDGKPLYSILNRKFTQLPGKNPRGVFNATMQGSIAHAMQLSIRRVWEHLGDRLLMEVHDSIVVTCDPTKSSMKSTIGLVTDIMCHPFRGVLDSDPAFSVRVSVGEAWRKWSEYKVFCG